MQLIRNLRNNFSYTNIDLVETLYVCYYFLKRNSNKKVILLDEEKIKNQELFGDILLVPERFKDKINWNVDLFFNACSLAEMNKQYVNEYINLVNTGKPKIILHLNSNFLEFPDSKRHIETLASEFHFDSSYFTLLTFFVSPWAPGYRDREFIYFSKDLIKR
ncbi:MAG: hypothetical protein KKC46_14625 [Proteobacteria bacterium]|nr:hypothetical protein [Pseudomonadota bacterium]